jgi:conjugative transfer signal peptidase TraF
MNRVERVAITGMFALAGTMLSFEVAARYGLRFNVDASMPLGAYRFVAGPVWRGAIVQSCLPAKLAEYARRRHYLLDGSCASGLMPVVKVLAALPGDAVVVSDSGVSIDGKRWPMSGIRRFDSFGRPVDLRLPSGRMTCAPDSVFLMGENSRSWDSRYVGCVPRSTIAGRWIPVLTFSQKEEAT